MSDNKGRSGGHEGFVTCARCGVQFPATDQAATPIGGGQPINLGHGCAAFMVQHEAGTMLVATKGSDYATSLYQILDENGVPAFLPKVIAPVCDVCIRQLDEGGALKLIQHE